MALPETAMMGQGAKRTALSSEEEAAFLEWYAKWAKIAGLDPNPDDPRHFYDYRGAFKAGEEPKIDPSDGRYHWSSAFKDDAHPNLIVNGQNTKTGEMMSMKTEDLIPVQRSTEDLFPASAAPSESSAGQKMTTEALFGLPETEIPPTAVGEKPLGGADLGEYMKGVRTVAGAQLPKDLKQLPPGFKGKTGLAKVLQDVGSVYAAAKDAAASNITLGNYKANELEKRAQDLFEKNELLPSDFWLNVGRVIGGTVGLVPQIVMASQAGGAAAARLAEAYPALRTVAGQAITRGSVAGGILGALAKPEKEDTFLNRLEGMGWGAASWALLDLALAGADQFYQVAKHNLKFNVPFQAKEITLSPQGVMDIFVKRNIGKVPLTAEEQAVVDAVLSQGPGSVKAAAKSGLSLLRTEGPLGGKEIPRRPKMKDLFQERVWVRPTPEQEKFWQDEFGWRGQRMVIDGESVRVYAIPKGEAALMKIPSYQIITFGPGGRPKVVPPQPGAAKAVKGALPGPPMAQQGGVQPPQPGPTEPPPAQGPTEPLGLPPVSIDVTPDGRGGFRVNVVKAGEGGGPPPKAPSTQEISSSLNKYLVTQGRYGARTSAISTQSFDSLLKSATKAHEGRKQSFIVPEMSQPGIETKISMGLAESGLEIVKPEDGLPYIQKRIGRTAAPEPPAAPTPEQRIEHRPGGGPPQGVERRAAPYVADKPGEVSFRNQPFYWEKRKIVEDLEARAAAGEDVANELAARRENLDKTAESLFITVSPRPPWPDDAPPEMRPAAVTPSPPPPGAPPSTPGVAPPVNPPGTQGAALPVSPPGAVGTETPLSEIKGFVPPEGFGANGIMRFRHPNEIDQVAKARGQGYNVIVVYPQKRKTSGYKAGFAAIVSRRQDGTVGAQTEWGPSAISDPERRRALPEHVRKYIERESLRKAPPRRATEHPFMDWIIEQGGISWSKVKEGRYTGELQALREWAVRTGKKIFRSNGRSIDEITERMNELAGRSGQDEWDIDEVVERLRSEMGGTPSPIDEERMEALLKEQDRVALEEETEYYRQLHEEGLLKAYRESPEELTADELAEATKLFGPEQKGMARSERMTRTEISAPETEPMPQRQRAPERRPPTTETAPVVFEDFITEEGKAEPPVELDERGFPKGRDIVDEMAARKAKLQIDVEREIEISTRDLLGQNPGVSIVNEVFQNSLDADATTMVVEIEDQYSHGIYGSEVRYVSFTDNGTGMSQKDLIDKMLVLSNVGKTEEQAGGYGRAKLVILRYPERVKISSVRRGRLNWFEATRDQVTSLAKNIEVHSEPAPADRYDGTRVEMWIPSSDYEQRDQIRLLQSAIMNFASKHQRDFTITQKSITADYGEWDVVKGTFAKTKRETGTTVYQPEKLVEKFPTETVLADGSEIEIQYVEEPIPTYASSWGQGFAVPVEIQNRGIPLDNVQKVEALTFEKPDYKIIVNFKRTPRVDDPAYPFIKNRTEIRDVVKKKIQEKIDETQREVNAGLHKKAKDLLQKDIDTAPTFGGVKVVLKGIQDGALKDELKAVLKENEQILEKVGQTFLLFKNLLGRLGEKDIELVISVDPKTHGWRPNSAIGLTEVYAINPFTIDESYLKGVFGQSLADRTAEEVRAASMSHTMVHEYAHNKVSGHYEAFSSELARLYTVIGHKYMALLDAAFEDALKKYGAQYDTIQKAVIDIYDRLAQSGQIVRGAEAKDSLAAALEHPKGGSAGDLTSDLAPPEKDRGVRGATAEAERPAEIEKGRRAQVAKPSAFVDLFGEEMEPETPEKRERKPKEKGVQTLPLFDVAVPPAMEVHAQEKIANGEQPPERAPLAKFGFPEMQVQYEIPESAPDQVVIPPELFKTDPPSERISEAVEAETEIEMEPESEEILGPEPTKGEKQPIEKRRQTARLLADLNITELFKDLNVPRAAMSDLYLRIVNNFNGRPEDLHNYVRTTIRRNINRETGEWMDRKPLRKKRGAEFDHVSILDQIDMIDKGTQSTPTQGEGYYQLLEAEETARIQNAIRANVSKAHGARDYEIVKGKILDDMTYAELGAKYGVTPERARQITSDVFQKIKDIPGMDRVIQKIGDRRVGFLFGGITPSEKEGFVRWVQRWFRSDRGAGEIADMANDYRLGYRMAEVFEATKEAEKLEKYIKKIGDTPAVREYFRDLLTQGVPFISTAALPQDIRDLLLQMRNRIDDLSLAIMEFVNLSPALMDTFIANLGTYLTRKYRKHRQKSWTPPRWARDNYERWLRQQFPGTYGHFTAEEMDNFLRAAARGAPTYRVPIAGTGSTREIRVSHELFKHRKEVPKVVRDFLGEITDPVWLYLYTVTHQAIAAYNAQFLTVISEVFPDLHTNDLNIARENGWQETRLPDGYSYGNMAGEYIHPDLWRYFKEEMPGVGKRLEHYLQAFLATPFKATRTVMSIPTHMRNFLGNTAFSMIGRCNILNPMNRQYYQDAMKIILGKDGARPALGIPDSSKEWADLMRRGITETQWWGSEIPNRYHDLLRLDPDRWPDMISRWIDEKGPGRIVEWLGNLYNFEDQLFRIAADIKNRKHFGMTPEESTQEINISFQNYRKMPEFVNVLKKTMILGPFITFRANVFKIVGSQIARAVEEIRAGSGNGPPLRPPSGAAPRWAHTPPPGGGTPPPGGGGRIPTPPLPPGRGGEPGRGGRGTDKGLLMRGITRLMTLAFVLFLPDMISEASRALVGMTAEEQREFEENCLVEYRRGGKFIWFRYKKGPSKGKLGIIDLAWIWPMMEMRRSMGRVLAAWQNKASTRNLIDSINLLANPYWDAVQIMVEGQDPTSNLPYPRTGNTMLDMANRLLKLGQYIFLPSALPVPDIVALIKEGKIRPSELTGSNYRGLLQSIVERQASSEYIHGVTKNVPDEVMAFITGIRKFQFDPEIEAAKYRRELVKDIKQFRDDNLYWQRRNPNASQGEKDSHQRRADSLVSKWEQKLRILDETLERFKKSRAFQPSQ